MLYAIPSLYNKKHKTSYRLSKTPLAAFLPERDKGYKPYLAITSFILRRITSRGKTRFIRLFAP
jgi:hypothetical protein